HSPHLTLGTSFHYLRSSSFLFTPSPTPEIYTLSLHDALPISSSPTDSRALWRFSKPIVEETFMSIPGPPHSEPPRCPGYGHEGLDRKSTRLNSSHVKISYAVFCLKKKKKKK